VAEVARRRGWPVITTATGPLPQVDPDLGLEELP